MATLDQIDPAQHMTLKNMTELTASMEKARGEGIDVLAGLREGKGMFLFGAPGIGKTHLLVGLTRLALTVGMVATWENAATLAAQIRDSYSLDDKDPMAKRYSRTQIIKRVIAHDVVMLDDLGRERDTEDARSIVYELIDGLYSMRRTVFLATNLSLEEYESRYDEAVRSRLAHMARKLDVKGPDRRRKEPYAR